MRVSLLVLALLLAPSQSRQADQAAAPGGESYQFKAEWRLIHAGGMPADSAGETAGMAVLADCSTAGNRRRTRRF